MKVLITVAILLVPGVYPQLCNVRCLPEDEFPRRTDTNNVPVTREWSSLMALLDEKTFKLIPYTKTCPGGNKVFIDQNSDVIWKLRATIYKKRQDETPDKTIRNCYCQETNCGATFQICMSNARIAMVADINAIWDAQIETALTDLCNLST